MAAAQALWYACHYPRAEVYCLANDGTQARDRVFAAIKNSLGLHKPPGLEFEVTNDRIVTSLGSVIQVVPCNASGAAGANPSLTVFTEVWAYTTPQKQQLFAEMTPPPTRIDPLRIVESYAGYAGQNSPLRQLYELTVLDGRPYDNPNELPDLPVWVNEDARIFYYYDSWPHSRRLPWQTDQYYREQEATLSPLEFRRIHHNLWIEGSAESLPVAWLEACIVPDPPAGAPDDLVVVGLDAGVTRSSFALAAVARSGDQLIVRDLRVWDPRGATLDFVAIEKELIEIIEALQPVEVAYDPYQLLEMMQRIAQGYIAFTNPYPQNSRAVADSLLVQLIRSRRLAVPESLASILRGHYNNTAMTSVRSGIRFVPVSQGRHIDLMVALAMACHRALSYFVS